jgi:hypothetical protein
MSESRKAGSVILGNFTLFNESVMYFESAIQPKFLEAFDNVVKVFSEQENWFGGVNFKEEEDSWFALPSWNMGTLEDYDHLAWMAVDYPHSSEDAGSYKLADLCGVGRTLGFCFHIQHKCFGGVRKWNNFYLKAASDFQLALADLGFSELKNGEFFIPITLDLQKVVQAWDDEAYDEAMQSVIDVLEKIKQAMPIFDALVKKAKQELEVIK